MKNLCCIDRPCCSEERHFNKTITDLISERIIIEAKRELYLTNKTVKEIAWELGCEDEFLLQPVF